METRKRTNSKKNKPLEQVDIFDAVKEKELTTISTRTENKKVEETQQEEHQLTSKEIKKLKQQEKLAKKQQKIEERKQKKLKEFTSQLEKQQSEYSDTPQYSKKNLTIKDIVENNSNEEDEQDKTFFSKLFDKNTKATLEIEKDVERFNPSIEEGLTKEQVEQRIKEGCTNKTSKKFSKSYKTIILENIFTFFNMLCFAIAGVLIYFGAIADCMFLLVCVLNMVIGLIQEIRAKQTIDKLSLVSAPNAKVMRDGSIVEIHTQDLVLEDIII